MPLARMLEQSTSFNLEAVAVLPEAFNGVVTELGLQATEEREKAAKLIIQQALDQKPRCCKTPRRHCRLNPKRLTAPASRRITSL